MNHTRSPRRVLAAIALGRGEVALAEELVSLCLDVEAADDPGCVPALEMLVRDPASHAMTCGAASEALERLRTVAGESRRRARSRRILRVGRGARFAPPRATRARLVRLCRRRCGASPRCTCRSRRRARAARAPPGRWSRAPPDAAVAEARLALRAFERIGATADADRHGGTPTPTRRFIGRAFPRHYGKLTKRETQVPLALLAEGCSNG